MYWGSISSNATYQNPEEYVTRYPSLHLTVEAAKQVPWIGAVVLRVSSTEAVLWAVVVEVRVRHRFQVEVFLLAGVFE